MAKYKTHKSNDFSVISNYHFRDKNLSLKAKGLLGLMLSLPDNWDYSINGLETLSTDGRESIANTLKELEQNKYLKRTQIRENGKIVDWEYDIYEKPLTGFPDVAEPDVVEPDVGKPIQYNTKEYNTKELIKKEEIYKEEKSNFKKPTIEEIDSYCLERKNSITGEKFYNYYESVGWFIGKKKMKDWKACVRTWEEKNKNSPPQQYGKQFNNYQDTQLVKTEEGTFKLR